jgi:hypothetical protein
MHQHTNPMAAAAEPLFDGGNATPEAGAQSTSTSIAPAHPTAKGIDLGRLRIRYLKSPMEMGWGHDEGDCASRTLFALSHIYEGDRRTAFRIIAGRHSLWFFHLS